MKKIMRYGLICVCFISFVMPALTFGDDFVDHLDYAITTAGGIGTVAAEFNGSFLSGQWNDVNGNRELDDNETIIFLDLYGRGDSRSGTPSLSIPNSVVFNDQLETWVEANADEILAILFAGEVENATGQQAANSMAAQLFSNTVLQKVQTDIEVALNSEFKGSLEYQKIDVNGNSGNAYSLVCGYSYDLDSGIELGFNIPYRYAEMSDAVNSESHYIGLDIFGKKAIVEWDDMTLFIGGDIFGSAYFLSSDAIDGSGTLKYGAGIFTSFVKELKVGSVSFGLDYRISEAYLPSSMNDNDSILIKKAVDYVNDLDSIHTITYGINYGIPLLNDTLAVNIELIRSNFISSDIPSDRENKTVVGISCSYFPTQTFSLNVGVHQSFELKDLDTLGIVLGALYRF